VAQKYAHNRHDQSAVFIKVSKTDPSFSNLSLGDAEAQSGGVDRQMGMYHTQYHPSL
jgi:hypothetical protein